VQPDHLHLLTSRAGGATKPEERWVLIANPISGKGRHDRLVRQVADHLQKARGTPRILWTARRGHAEELAAAAVREGATHVVAIGGDGTIHEIVNGIVNARTSVDSVILGILPMGTCNDLARELNIPRQLSSGMQTLLSGRVRLVDLGKVGERYFMTVATLGFNTSVSQYLASGAVPGSLSGTLKYLYGALATLFRYHSVRAHLRGDNNEFEGLAFLAAIANTSYFGGGMKIAPTAVIDDGYLTLCLVRQMSRLEVVRMLPTVFSGKHIRHPKISTSIFRTLEVTSGGPLAIWADGEPVARTPATFQVAPYSLPLLVPHGGTAGI
jgi:diacylglycerol kinase (ATP)